MLDEVCHRCHETQVVNAEGDGCECYPGLLQDALEPGRCISCYQEDQYVIEGVCHRCPETQVHDGS